MRCSLILLLAACHTTGRAPTPAPIACRPDRIGPVVVTGAERALVPSLTVLEGTADEPERVQRIAGAAVDALHARGYARATLDVTRAGCGLAVAVELGTRYKLAHIEFITDDDFSNQTRLSILEDTLGSVNAVGGAYVAERLTGALARLQQRYRDAGWVDAVVQPAIATFVGARISLRIPVRAGRRVLHPNISLDRRVVDVEVEVRK